MPLPHVKAAAYGMGTKEFSRTNCVRLFWGSSDPAPGRDTIVELRCNIDDMTAEELNLIDRVYVIACGTSYHAGLIAKEMIESWARIPTEVEVASEFRYRNPIITPTTLVVAVSQSGETADTLAAIRDARMK
jgi:glucosamine 6-phosphate synthetase-like amidotransferase/phosphosugar isomerase protein